MNSTPGHVWQPTSRASVHAVLLLPYSALSRLSVTVSATPRFESFYRTTHHRPLPHTRTSCCFLIKAAGLNLNANSGTRSDEQHYWTSARLLLVHAVLLHPYSALSITVPTF